MNNKSYKQRNFSLSNKKDNKRKSTLEKRRLFEEKRKEVLRKKFLPGNFLRNKGPIQTVKQFQDEMLEQDFDTIEELKEYLHSRIGHIIHVYYQYEETPIGDENNWNVPETKVVRVALSTKKSTKIRTEFEQLCKGLVFSYPDWKQLTFPTRVLRRVRSLPKEVLENIDLYKVYKMYDGTLINLFFQKKWIISSTSGIELNDLTWLGKKTYEEAFFELLGDDKDELISTHTYSFVMKHPDFHPIDGHDYGLTLIHEFDLQKREYLQETALKTVPFQESLTVNEELVEEIKRQLNSGYKNVHELATNISNKKEYSRPVYGYILRTMSDKVPKHLANLSVETPLFSRFIRAIYSSSRETIQERSKQPIVDEEGLEPVHDEGFVEREKYVLVRLLMRQDDIANTIIKLCPKYAEVYTRLKTNLLMLSDKTKDYVTLIRKRSMFKNSTSNVDKLAAKIGDVLLKNNTNMQKQAAKLIVADNIIDISNAKLYSRYL